MSATQKEVLFQKLGNVWFVFSEVEGDVIYSQLPEGVNPKSTNLELFEIIEDHLKKVASLEKRSPEAAA